MTCTSTSQSRRDVDIHMRIFLWAIGEPFWPDSRMGIDNVAAIDSEMRDNLSCLEEHPYAMPSIHLLKGSARQSIPVP